MATSNISLVPPESAAPVVEDDPIPADVRAVIDLFSTHLAKVAFPDIDATTLRKLSEELRVEARAVAKARAALDAAQASFAHHRTELSDTATRAVAYARIYAESHADRGALVVAIAELEDARKPAVAAAAGAPATATGKRRGRPPKRSAELFDAAAAPETPAEET